jgi:fucokinase
VLERLGGGGIEIRTAVALPMGSGLGTSSIVSAVILRAIAEMLGRTLDDQVLSEQVMDLEQRMTTAAAGRIRRAEFFQAGKLSVTGPGMRQRIRVQPLLWTPERQAEFEERVVHVLHRDPACGARPAAPGGGAGIWHAKTACVQVLHSIKTLAMEMVYAIQDGEWAHWDGFLDRHWELNKTLDPNTANASDQWAVGRGAALFARGEVGGRGGGGFMIMLAKSPQAAAELKEFLAAHDPAEGGCRVFVERRPRWDAGWCGARARPAGARN